MISILATVSEMEKSQIRERQLKGIKIAKLKGVYNGRQKGTIEGVHAFLDKPKNRKVKKGFKLSEAAKLAGVHIKL